MREFGRRHGYRPVKKAPRLGEQNCHAYASGTRNDSAASASRFGVKISGFGHDP